MIGERSWRGLTAKRGCAGTGRQSGEVAGNLWGRELPRAGQLTGGVRAAGQGAQQPQPYRMRECFQSLGDRLQRYRLWCTWLGHRVLQHRLPAGSVDRQQVRAPEDARDEGDPVAVGGCRLVLKPVHDDAVAVRRQGDRGGDGCECRADALALQQVLLHAQVGGELRRNARPGCVEEGLGAL